MVSFFQRLVDKMEMRQLFDNPFTALQSALKMRWSHHKQIQAAAFVGQTIYCIISNQSCIISSQSTVRRSLILEVFVYRHTVNFYSQLQLMKAWKKQQLDIKSITIFKLYSIALRFRVTLHIFVILQYLHVNSIAVYFEIYTKWDVIVSAHKINSLQI